MVYKKKFKFHIKDEVSNVDKILICEIVPELKQYFHSKLHTSKFYFFSCDIEEGIKIDMMQIIYLLKDFKLLINDDKIEIIIK